ETTRAVTALILEGSLSRNNGVRLIVSHRGAFLPLVKERLQLFAGLLGTGDGEVDVEEVRRRAGRCPPQGLAHRRARPLARARGPQRGHLVGALTMAAVVLRGG